MKISFNRKITSLRTDFFIAAADNNYLDSPSYRDLRNLINCYIRNIHRDNVKKWFICIFFTKDKSPYEQISQEIVQNIVHESLSHEEKEFYNHFIHELNHEIFIYLLQRSVMTSSILIISILKRKLLKHWDLKQSKEEVITGERISQLHSVVIN